MPIAFRPPSPLIKATVAASSIETQSHSTLPCGVQTSSARWPIAKEGWVPMPMRPGSCWRHALKLRPASDVSVVQLCPVGGTYCRSSSQIVHRAGGLSLGAYCTPQAVQMKASMDQPIACWRGCYLAAGAARIACHTRSGVAGMSMWRMP